MNSSCDRSVSRGRVISATAFVAGSMPETRIGAFERDLVGTRTEVGEAVDEAREEGRLSGYISGRAEGTELGRALEREIHERARERAHDAVSRICDAIDVASAQHLHAIGALEARTLQLAVEIAEAVIGAEVGRDAARLTRLAVERSLALVPFQVTADVAMHPDDLALLGALDDLLVGRRVNIGVDHRVERGGCVVTFGDGSVRCQPSEALDRIRAALIGGDATSAAEPSNAVGFTEPTAERSVTSMESLR
jgi:flagellar biosynthesis/type III secretory pathway protein FliH